MTPEERAAALRIVVDEYFQALTADHWPQLPDLDVALLAAIRGAVEEERAALQAVVEAATALCSGVYGTGDECIAERTSQRLALVEALRALDARWTAAIRTRGEGAG